MNYYITINDFKIENVYFFNPIKNTMLINSSYIKVIYSTIDVVLNSIHILIPCDINNNILNHYKDRIISIETLILDKYSNKKQCNNILHNIKTNNCCNKCNNNCILKISGIWENKHECGLIYKYVYPSVL